MQPSEEERAIAGRLAQELSARHGAKLSKLSLVELVAEFKAYVSLLGLPFDADRVMADMLLRNVPDSTLAEGLTRLASVAGAMLGRGPISSSELRVALKELPVRPSFGGVGIVRAAEGSSQPEPKPKPAQPGDQEVRPPPLPSEQRIGPPFVESDDAGRGHRHRDE
jgi:hypothetical protein